ncbi:BRCA1-associated RING domain protein 1-like [Hydra vulgaris]|uniref:BRCA1-associated RING domain protein 1-like n=1 Tax=Hydra vulgaris TaxID=6087 RepID=A0ABM4CL32_HYDVU
MFNSIKENILPIHNLNIGIDISELQNELNPFLELCLCCKCNKIPQMPVTLKSCEHLFCFLCLVEEMKNKYIDETFCPKYNKKIYIDDMVTSKKTNSLLQMLTLVCNLCKQKFNALKEYEIFKTHKSLCHNELLLSTSLLTSSSNSKKSINDIFEINKDSDIPQELEEAALHIIKQKMAKSGQKTIEFKSGGPRPMIFTHAPKAYVNSAKAAQSTLRLRNTNIAKHFETLAGNLNDAVANQTSKLLNSLSRDTRHSILDNAGLNHSEISANVMVAMKTDMGVPREKLKIMSS